MASDPIRKVYEDVRSRRDANGRARIEPKEVAKIIRRRLKNEFPETKFSVRVRHGTSIDVDWVDGPLQAEVERIVGAYSFGGFDGMIDLAYNISNWLLPDGRVTTAESPGTEGSRGAIPAEHTDCPEPGAVIVSGGPRFVFANRTLSDERTRILIQAAQEVYGESGVPLDPDRPLHAQFVPGTGDNLCQFAWQYEKWLHGEVSFV